MDGTNRTSPITNIPGDVHVIHQVNSHCDRKPVAKSSMFIFLPLSVLHDMSSVTGVCNGPFPIEETLLYLDIGHFRKTIPNIKSLGLDYAHSQACL